MNKVNDVHLIDFLPGKKRCKTNFMVRESSRLVECYREFRNYDCFKNPRRGIESSNMKLPSLLISNPDLHKATIHFCWENIDTLSVEAVHSFLLHDALPKLRDTIQKERGLDTFTTEHLLAEHGLRTLNVKTIHNWMKRIGFKYEPRKKSIMLICKKQKMMLSIEPILSRSILIMKFVLTVCILRVRVIKW